MLQFKDNPLPAVKFQHLLAVLYKNVRHTAGTVSSCGGGFHLAQENLLVEGEDQLHVPKDEVRLVGHAGLTAGHPLLVASQDALEVLNVLVLRFPQL